MTRRTLRILKISSLTITLTLLVFFGFGYYVMRKFVYRPSITPEKQATIDKAYGRLMALDHAHTITLTTQDNQHLTGIFIDRPQAHRVILLCHGYRMSKESMEHLVALFPHDTVLLFDFRAHGKSSGQFVSFGVHEKKDIFTAIHFLRTHPSTRDLPIVGLGISMGGASLLAAAADGAPFSALIIDSSFASLEDQIRYQFTKLTGLPTFLLPIAQVLFEYLTNAAIASMVPADFIRKVSCPVLIIHSQDDLFTPVSHAHALLASCQQGKSRSCWIDYKAKHGFLSHEHPDEYTNKITTFLQRIP